MGPMPLQQCRTMPKPIKACILSDNDQPFASVNTKISTIMTIVTKGCQLSKCRFCVTTNFLKEALPLISEIITMISLQLLDWVKNRSVTRRNISAGGSATIWPKSSFQLLTLVTPFQRELRRS